MVGTKFIKLSLSKRSTLLMFIWSYVHPRVSRRTHPSKFGGLSTNKANLELMRRSQRQLGQIYRYRHGGEVRTRGKEAGKGSELSLLGCLLFTIGFFHDSYSEKDDGWIPSSDFVFFLHLLHASMPFLIYLFHKKNIKLDQNYLKSLW